MFGFGWLTLRQAQVALKAGRLDEAQRLLFQPNTRNHRRAGELIQQLAQALAERGERLLRLDDPEAAWLDLLKAEQLQTTERSVDRLRQSLSRLGIAQVRAMLQAGEITRASQVLGQLHDRRVRGAEMQLLEEAARNWLHAQELAEKGDFAQALQTVERMQRLLIGPSAPLEKLYQSLQERQERFASLLGRLHEASATGQWREVVEVAEQVLAAAPQHLEARKARARAWKAIEPVTVAHRPTEAIVSRPFLAQPSEELTRRFCLWIDGIGGYLVCLGGRVTLGQSSSDGAIDIPLVADVSRVHATLSRDSEGGYLLEAARPVSVNGQGVTRTVLRNGDRITLGPSCQLQFRQMVPVSNSVRLDVVSGHRFGLGVDSVLLMGDTLIFGDSAQVHVSIPGLKDNLVVFRNKERLGVRYPGPLTVNGERSQDRILLGANATVVGEDFSFTIESIADRTSSRA